MTRTTRIRMEMEFEIIDEFYGVGDSTSSLDDLYEDDIPSWMDEFAESLGVSDVWSM